VCATVPLDYVDGMNVYAYVNGNTANMTDPLGQSLTALLAKAMGATGQEYAEAILEVRDRADTLLDRVEGPTAPKWLERTRLAANPAGLVNHMAWKTLRGAFHSWATREARYYASEWEGVADREITYGDILSADYEVKGSVAFELLPVFGSLEKGASGTVIDDQGTGSRKLSSWGRAGYFASATVEAALLVAPTFVKIKPGGGLRWASKAEILGVSPPAVPKPMVEPPPVPPQRPTPVPVEAPVGIGAPGSGAGAGDLATTPLQRQLTGLSDDALVHFSPGEYSTVKPGAGGELFTYRYGDIKHLTPRQVETLIGPLAKAGETGGARVMHVLDTTIDAATTRPGAVVPDFTEYILSEPVEAPTRIPIQ